MKLIIIVPAFNEDKTIQELLNRIPKQIEGINEIITVVVNDGSTDKTAQIALANNAHVISNRKNSGVGASFQAGIKFARKHNADFIVNIDADLQFRPEDIPVLLVPLLNGAADFATASRFIDPKLKPTMPIVKYWGNKMMSHLISSIVGIKIYDVSCGFRAYTRDVIDKLNLFGHFTYTQESMIEIVKKGFTIIEIPLKINGVREHGKSRVANNIIAYAFKSFYIILKALRDVKPVLFFGIISSFSTLIGLILLLVVMLSRTKFIFQFSNQTEIIFLVLFVVFLICAALLMILGLVADMLSRIKELIEEVLWEVRKSSD